MTRGTGPLSNTTGPVLDPIISLRRTITLPPHETAVVNMVLGATETATPPAQVEKYQGTRMAERAFDLAWTHSQVTLHHSTSRGRGAALRQAGRRTDLCRSRPRGPSPVLRNNRRGQSGLWSYGISGDSPIVLLRISDPSKSKSSGR
jgi:cyclic beta-1,2-glucan synthetase